MKKIFTLLGGMLLAATSIASAESVTLQVCTSKGVEVAKSCESELSRDDAGNYVIADFLNSGSPVTFSFDSNVEVGKKAAIEIKGNVDADDPYMYLLDADGEDMVCTINPLEGDDAIGMYYPYIYYGEKYTYVTHLDKAEEGSDYVARICVSGWDAENTALDWYYIFMYFDEIPYDGKGEDEPGDDTPEAKLINTLDVTVYDNGSWYYPDYSDDDNYEDISLKSFDAKLEIYDDGTYTLKNIYGSDYSISYTYGKFNPKNMAAVTFTGKLYREEGYTKYPYFLTPDNNYMTVTVEEESGEKLTVDYLQGSELTDYTYIYKCTEAEIAEGYSQYYVYMYLSGYVGDDAAIDMTVYFGYDDPTSAVSAIESNDNAPVEFYNLNGQRVSDPSNGIFIRRQGSKTSKIMVK